MEFIQILVISELPEKIFNDNTNETIYKVSFLVRISYNANKISNISYLFKTEDSAKEAIKELKPYKYTISFD